MILIYRFRITYKIYQIRLKIIATFAQGKFLVIYYVPSKTLTARIYKETS